MLTLTPHPGKPTDGPTEPSAKRSTPATDRGGPGARPPGKHRTAPTAQMTERSSSTRGRPRGEGRNRTDYDDACKACPLLSCHPQGRRPGSPRQEVAGSG